jgi:hypothetical protein
MNTSSNIREIYCTNIIDSGSGFAIETETGDVVYIPVSVTRASGIQVGEVTMARLVPNTNAKSGSTPLMAIQIISGAQGPRSEERAPSAPTPAPAPAPARPSYTAARATRRRRRSTTWARRNWPSVSRTL